MTVKYTTKEGDILKIIKHHGVCKRVTIDEDLKNTDISPPQIESALRRLKRKRTIEKIDGSWRLMAEPVVVDLKHQISTLTELARAHYIDLTRKITNLQNIIENKPSSEELDNIRRKINAVVAKKPVFISIWRKLKMAKKPEEYRLAWRKFYKHFKINSYHELKNDQLIEAMAYLDGMADQ